MALTTLWRLVAASPLTWKSAANAADDANDFDEEDDSAPTVDECVELREQLMSKLMAIETDASRRLKAACSAFWWVS